MAFYHPEFDPDLEGLFSDADVSWLEQFIKELRPFLIANRAAALQGLIEWNAWKLEQQQRLAAFERKQRAYLFLSWVNDWHECDEGPDEWVRIYGWIAYHSISLWGWGPREVSADNEPAVYRTLPLPNNRDLQLCECWTVLIAVHDITRIPSERIKPDDNQVTSNSVDFAELCIRAAQLTEDHLPDLRRLLGRVADTVANTIESTAVTRTSAFGTRAGSAVVTAADLAGECGVETPVMNTALTKYAKKHPNCRERIENPKPREPKFIYRRELIGPVIERYKGAGRNSKDSPKK